MSAGSGGRGLGNSSSHSIVKGNAEVAASGNPTEAMIPNNTELHFELEDMYCEPIESLPLALISGGVAVATIAANSLVILAILRGSSRFHRPMYSLIIHLSFADLIVGFMLLWNYCLASLLEIQNTITSLMVIFCIWVTSEAASTLGFVLLAVDRYIQIFHKTFHRTYITKVSVGLAISLTWAITIGIFSLAPIAFGWSCKNSCNCTLGNYMECLPRTDCSQIVPPFKKSYTLTISAMLFFTIPIPVAVYTTIFIKVRRKTQVVRHSHRRHDMRLIRTLSVILAVFIVTLCPVAILASIDYTNTEKNTKMIDIAFYIFVLAFLNSLANPLLYMWRMAAIRRSIRKIFGLAKNGQTARREFTSYQSDQRSPTCHRQRHDTDTPDNLENHKFISQNNNVPRAAVLCLRQMKKGKYTNSRTSTPLSERAENHNCENHVPECNETARLSRDSDQEIQVNGGDIHIERYCDKNENCEITEL